MITKKNKNQIRQVRHTRLRKNLSGTASCPRLNVYRSLKHIYAQIINDENGTTSSSTQVLSKSSMTNLSDFIFIFLSNHILLSYFFPPLPEDLPSFKDTFSSV